MVEGFFLALLLAAIGLGCFVAAQDIIKRSNEHDYAVARQKSSSGALHAPRKGSNEVDP